MTVERIVQLDSGETEPEQKLVGRDRALERLEELLVEHARFVTISGPPGVGKTHLVAALTERLEGRRFAEVIHPELRAVEMGAELRQVVAGALGVGESDRLEERIEMALSSRDELLVVLDGVDAIVRDTDRRRAFGQLLRGWLRAAPALHVLVSCRRRIDEPDEHCFDLKPLSGEAGADLFEQRAQRVRDDFQVDASNREAVRAVVEQLDGLPQAIELAAARCRVLGPEQLLERLRDRSGADEPSDDFLFAPLDRAFDEIWTTLPDWAREAARQVRVFRGPFAPGVAEEVLEFEVEGPGALEALEYLLDRSLLEATAAEDGSGVRIEMLRTVRRFVDRRSGDLDEEAARRHAEAYRTRSLEWWRARGTAEAATAKASLAEAELQIEAAFERSFDRGWSAALDLAVGLVTYLTDCHRYRPARTIVERLRSGDFGSESPRARATLDYAESYLNGVAGDFRGLRERAERAAEAAGEADAPVLLGRIELAVVLSHYVDGAFDDAIGTLDRAMARIREHSGVADRVKAHLQYARVYRASGDQRRAERHIRDALELAKQHDLPGRRMRARLHLGLLYAELETFDAALEHVEVADELNDELADWNYESFVPAVAGSIYHAAGRFSRAEPLYKKGVRAKRREGGVGSVADALVEYGLLLLETDEPGRARQAFAESRRLAPGSHCRNGFDLFGAQRLGEALSYALEGRLEPAREEFEDARRRAEELEDAKGAGESGETEADAGPPDLFPAMLEHGRIVLDLWELREEVEGDDLDAGVVEERLGRAENRIDSAGSGPVSFNAFVATRRLAYRELERARRAVGAETESAPDRPLLRVGSDLSWMEVDGASREDLSRRGALRRVLESLLEAHDAAGDGGEARSVYDLLEAGWSEQPADPDSGKSRVYTTIARLRELGLEEVLETVDGGYRLHPDLEVEVE